MHQLKSYLKFLFRSTNAHGVHSPFVYDVVTKCFYDKTQYPAYKRLKQYRNLLKKDTSVIEVTDFGQGSRVFKSNTRKVSDIARYAGMSQKRQRLLFRLTQYFSSEKILELGTSLGLATAALSLGNPDANIVTVEGCPNTARKAKELFQSFQLTNIQLNNSRFETFFSEIKEENYQLVFIDGNHNKEKTLAYFETLLPNVSEDSIVIFDDIYWSRPMTEAWQQISNHPQVTVSIDTFQWGIVTFRKTQPKQHFTIRV
ncbi:O-methyltransferase [Jejudonia soesokkakensis]|uniref:O-methyltransferase n=1 Tax=Jejudonia soesokkakensis TaxID=1323432 RepID=A0ABW2MVN1_9FLAO